MVDSMMTINIRRPTKHERFTCPLIDLTSNIPGHPEEYTDPELSSEDYNELVDQFEERHLNIKRTERIVPDPAEYSKYFLFPVENVMKKTLQNTTKYDSINMRIPMRQHYKARNPLLSRRRILEPYATDTWFSTTTSYEGCNCAQIFSGVKSKTVSRYGMKSETDGPAALLNLFQQEGVPLSIKRDNSKMQTSKLWKTTAEIIG